MSDLINRQEAVAHLQRIREASADTTGYNEGFADGLDFCISFISTLPSTEPERKQGEWIEKCSYDGMRNYYYCTLCGVRNDWKSNFCPHCGVDMRKEE